MPRIVIPAVAAVFLFIFSAYFLFLPKFEQSLFDARKMMIKELVLSSWHMIQHLDKEVQAGKLSLDKAQAIATRHLREMRYGGESKDYFWISDFESILIMHPYRTDLEGDDLSTYADPMGKKLFKEFVKVAKEKDQGYVSYLWQWKDDQSRIAPKLSFVKAFVPWGWIIGTGIYTDDVEQEITSMQQKFIVSSAIILCLVSLVAKYQIYQSINALRQQQGAEAELVEYKNQLEVKVQKRTEEISKANADLQKALAEVNTLSGFLPICSSCKKIRDDSGYWNQIETYIERRSEAQFSHSICENCARKLYPDFDYNLNS